MQIVIEIREKSYKLLQTFKDKDLSRPEIAVKHGIPLPKAHGRLIDADSLDLERLYRENDDGSFSLVHTESEYRTIIEADKEDDE